MRLEQHRLCRGHLREQHWVRLFVRACGLVLKKAKPVAPVQRRTPSVDSTRPRTAGKRKQEGCVERVAVVESPELRKFRVASNGLSSDRAVRCPPTSRTADVVGVVSDPIHRWPMASIPAEAYVEMVESLVHHRLRIDDVRVIAFRSEAKVEQCRGGDDRRNAGSSRIEPSDRRNA